MLTPDCPKILASKQMRVPHLLISKKVRVFLRTDDRDLLTRSLTLTWIPGITIRARPPFMFYPNKNIRLEPQRYVGHAAHFIAICCEAEAGETKGWRPERPPLRRQTFPLRVLTLPV